MIVMKFGGTSLGDAERISEAARIVADTSVNDQIVVVVSAVSSVTNTLVSAAQHASNKNMGGLHHDLLHLNALHSRIVSGLELTATAETRLNKIIDDQLSSLRKLLESIFELGELTPRALDLILSFGERLSIQLVGAALIKTGIPAKPIEATKLIVTNEDFGNAQPILDKSETQTRPIIHALLDKNIVPVITGFIGATPQGITTTLGRGGSDYTASILGNCLNADEIYIWTDVDGAMTADPRILSEAKTIPALSYSEASEIAYFGAKVLHPLTLVPASLKNIPIWVKNTTKPKGYGTKISDRVWVAESRVKTISTLSSVSVIIVQGKGMTGVPGVAAKVFSSIAAAHINVLFISQASSECNISLVVKHDSGAMAVRILYEAFEAELDKRMIEDVSLEENLALVALVGDGMKGYSGIAGKAFSCLGAAGISIVAIAQGSSERSISFVVTEADVPLTVQRLHSEFQLSKFESVR